MTPSAHSVDPSQQPFDIAPPPGAAYPLEYMLFWLILSVVITLSGILIWKKIKQGSKKQHSLVELLNTLKQNQESALHNKATMAILLKMVKRESLATPEIIANAEKLLYQKSDASSEVTVMVNTLCMFLTTSLQTAPTRKHRI